MKFIKKYEKFESSPIYLKDILSDKTDEFIEIGSKEGLFSGNASLSFALTKIDETDKYSFVKNILDDMRKFSTEILSNLSKTTNRYGDGIFYRKKNEDNSEYTLIYQDDRNQEFYVDSEKIWLAFGFKFQLNYPLIQLVLTDILNEHFKTDNYKPYAQSQEIFLLLAKSMI